MLLFTKDISFPLLSFVSFIYYPGPRHLPYTQLGDSLSFIFYFILSPSPYIIQDPGTLHTTQALALHSIRTPSLCYFLDFFSFYYPNTCYSSLKTSLSLYFLLSPSPYITQDPGILHITQALLSLNLVHAPIIPKSFPVYFLTSFNRDEVVAAFL